MSSVNFVRFSFVGGVRLKMIPKSISENLSVKGCPPSQSPTQMFKNGLSIFFPHEIGSSLISFEMIFEAQQFETISILDG